MRYPCNLYGQPASPWLFWSKDPPDHSHPTCLLKPWLDSGTGQSRAGISVKPRMLCATDSSRHSLRVAARAAAMANQLDATLTLLHVMSAEDQGRAGYPERVQLQLKSIRATFRHEPVVRLHAGDYLSTISTIAAEAGA